MYDGTSANSDQVTFPDRTTWWIAKEYETLEGTFVQPAKGTTWPEDFTVYKPLEATQTDSMQGPHTTLLNMDFDKPDVEVIKDEFIDQYGLLGLGYSPFYRKYSQDEFWYGVINRLQSIHSNQAEERTELPVFFNAGGEERTIDFVLLYPPKRNPLKDPEDGQDYHVYKDPTSFKQRYGETAENYSGTSFHSREIYGEWLGEVPPEFQSNWLPPETGSFIHHAKLFQDFKDKLDSHIQDPLEPDGRLTDDSSYQFQGSPTVVFDQGIYNLSFTYHCLFDACVIMLLLDFTEGRLHQCPQCFRNWRAPDTDDKRSDYCPPQGSVGQSCSELAAERKSRQRKSWRKFLNKHDPDLATKWENEHLNKHGNFKHPYDVMEELSPEEQLPSEEFDLALKWAKRTVKHSPRDNPDPWLQPLFEEEHLRS